MIQLDSHISSDRNARFLITSTQSLTTGDIQTHLQTPHCLKLGHFDRKSVRRTPLRCFWIAELNSIFACSGVGERKIQCGTPFRV